VTDELNRKTVEAMLWLVEQRESGRITESDFYLGAEVAFMIVNGLVDKDIAEMTWVPAPENYKSRTETAVLRKQDDLLLLRRNMSSNQVRPILIRNGRLASLKPSEGVTSLSSILKKMQAKGWIPITEEISNA
jgi:hypothetical protein